MCLISFSEYLFILLAMETIAAKPDINANQIITRIMKETPLILSTSSINATLHPINTEIPQTKSESMLNKNASFVNLLNNFISIYDRCNSWFEIHLGNLLNVTVQKLNESACKMAPMTNRINSAPP